jgi:hypothetical protein
MKRLILLSALLSFGALANVERPPDVPGVRVASAATLPSVSSSFIAQAPTEAAPAPAPASLGTTLRDGIIDGVGVAAMAALTMLMTWLRARAKGTALEGAIDTATHAVEAAVARAVAAAEPKLKQYLSDGVLDPAERKDLTDTVVSQLLLDLPAPIQAVLRGAFGDLTKLFEGKALIAIEARAAEARAAVRTTNDAAAVFAATPKAEAQS